MLLVGQVNTHTQVVLKGTFFPPSNPPIVQRANTSQQLTDLDTLRKDSTDERRTKVEMINIFLGKSQAAVKRDREEGKK